MQFKHCVILSLENKGKVACPMTLVLLVFFLSKFYWSIWSVVIVGRKTKIHLFFCFVFVRKIHLMRQYFYFLGNDFWAIRETSGPRTKFSTLLNYSRFITLYIAPLLNVISKYCLFHKKNLNIVFLFKYNLNKKNSIWRALLEYSSILYIIFLHLKNLDLLPLSMLRSIFVKYMHHACYI